MYGKLYKIFGRFTLPDYADKEILHDKSEVRSIRKKHQLIGCGMVANHFYFINEGLLRLYGFTEGEEKTLFFFKENMMAGRRT